MNRIIVAALAVIFLVGCAPPGAIQPGEVYKTRELTQQEKRALAPMVAAAMKDPEAARIKWMPVVLRERDGITDYCGLINGKNSFGAYEGYMRFYGHLMKNSEGRFAKINVRLIQTADDPQTFDPRWMNGLCEDYGYTDFSLAH